MYASPFVEHFGSLPDPRVDRTKLHPLLDILVIAVCAVIAGAEGWEDIAEFGRLKECFFRERLGLELPHGIPSPDTFRRVMARLDPDAFGRAFLAWTQTLRVRTKGEVVALDGKTLRHSFDTAAGQAPIHLVSAWAATNRLVLAQVKVDDKSNEITAFPALLALLDLRGCTVTIDAMGCQKEIARQIIAQEGDYVLALKANQGQIFEDVRLFFEDATLGGFAGIRVRCDERTEKDHGRIETRRYWLVKEIDWLEGKPEWAGLCSIGMAESMRRIGEKVETERRYFLCSLKGSARIFGRAVRRHWGIENGEHYVLDVSFHEDACRIRREHGAENFATLRHIALNLVRRERTATRGVKARLRRAGWDEGYLLRVLAPGS
jgi:predicted transposase YbfD/YdcC